MIVKVICVFLGLVWSLSGVAATMQSMSKAQIERTFFNKTYTSIPVDFLDNKSVNDSNTIYLDDNGKVIGEMGIKPKGEPKIDTGSYNISNSGVVTIQWQHWDFQNRLCFHIYQAKNAYITVDSHDVFHSVFMKSSMKLGNQITNK
ncbi:MAG: hypothetical protein P1U34_08040 [Coxiellaceae bacterium]|nr:hypothetical protein [Coxiellaceae bacterium]